MGRASAEEDSSAERNRNQPIHLLRENLGLITEKIAPLATSSTDWKIIQKTDLRPYFQANAELVEAARKVQSMCSKICENSTIVEEAVLATRRADRVMDLLLVNGAGESQQRARRALVPFVGSIHKFLWGTLDEDDKIEMQSAIKAVANDARQTAALLADQTEIIERELSRVDMRIDDLRKKYNFWAEQVLSLTWRTEVQTALAEVKDMLRQFNIDTEILTDAILFAAKGMVHPRMVAPETIRSAATTVGDTVINARFPLPEEGFSVIPIMGVSKLTVLLADGFLIYQIAVPLLDIQNFNLFKASPLPAIQKVLNISNLAVYIWPEHSYFAISESNRTYMPLTSEEVAGLRKLGKTLIAVNPEPVREIRSNVACEIKIASGRQILNPDICDIRFRQLRDTFWLRLHKANSWIFSTKHPEDIFIQCLRTEQVTARLNGAGILELRPGCAAHTANARLTASRAFATFLNESKFETIEVDVSKILCELNGSKLAEAELRSALASESANHVASLHGVKLENLKAGAGLHEIADKAREISLRKATEFELKNLSGMTSIFGWSLTSVVAAGASILIIGYIVYRRRSRGALDRFIKHQEALLMLEQAQRFTRERRHAEESLEQQNQVEPRH